MAERDEQRNQRKRGEPQRRARDPEAVLGEPAATIDALILHPQVTEKHGDARHRREQDEFLTERVERPDVEVQGGDDVGGMAQTRLEPVDDHAVDAVERAERRQSREADHEHGREARPGEREHPDARSPAHG